MWKSECQGAFSFAGFATIAWLCSIAFPISALSSDSENPDKYHVEAVRIDRKIDLTGKLSDPLWKLATPVQLNFEIQPGENTPAREKTFVYVLYNSDYIYFGFDCLDSNAKLIRTHITDRDKMTDDDFVGVILDTYGNRQSGYELMVNPSSIQFDAMRMGNNEDASFDAVWYSAGNVNDSGYTVEMAIPFKSLRFPATTEQHWLALFVRNMPRESRYQITWTPIDRNNPCILCQTGAIDGIKEIEASNNVEVLPYAMGVQSGSMNDTGDPQSSFTNGPITGRIGVGVRYAPSSSFAVAGVFNPDFSQIESDATQISVNNTFAIFYPEKRPFFLEGADLFSTMASVYYSRMINNPLASAKLTEKSGSFSLAYLVAEDRESPFIIPGEEESDFQATSLKSLSNVVRAKYALGSESFVGGLVTTRNFTNAHNYVGAVDWNFLFGGNFYFVGQAALSHTKEINDPSLFSSSRFFGSTSHTATFDGESYVGAGFGADIKRNARDYSFDLSISSVSPTFQAQDGFITSTNFHKVNFWHGYTIYPNNSVIENASLQTNSGMQFNYDGSRKGMWGSIQAQAQLKGQTYLYVAYYPVQDELFHSVSFKNLYRTEFSASTNPMSLLAINLWGSFGRFIYRTDTPESGRGYNLWGEIVLKPTDKFSLDLTCAYSRLWSFYNEANLFFDGYITRAAVVYQFSPQLLVRLISQYDKFAKQIQLDPLISYKLNPFTVFYAGSNHNFTYFGEGYGVERTVQQFFVKIQYLWQN